VAQSDMYFPWPTHYTACPKPLIIESTTISSVMKSYLR